MKQEKKSIWIYLTEFIVVLIIMLGVVAGLLYSDMSRASQTVIIAVIMTVFVLGFKEFNKNG